MRKLFALALIALLLGVGIVALIRTDPGYVLVAYGNYTLETSLWVGLVLLLLLVLLVFLALRLAYRVISGQRTLVTWLGTRKAHHAMRLSTRGLIHYTEGNWARARKQLEKGAQHNEAPLLNYLLAARASDRLGEPDRVQQFLQAAGDAESEAAIAVDITRAEMKLAAGEYSEALAILAPRRADAAGYPAVLQVMAGACVGKRDWDGALALLPDLKKQKVLPVDDYHELEREIHSHRLQQAGSPGALQAAWDAMPGTLREDTRLFHGYIDRLIALGDHASAEKAILRALKHQWDPALARSYGLVMAGDAAAQLARAEKWLPEHSEDAQLLISLGRLSARNKLWGKARDYFESSYRVERNAEICAELGRLLTALGEPKVAAAYYREGLQLRETALPDLPMPDQTATPGQLLARS